MAPERYLDPFKGSFRWAWRTTPKHRDRFAVSVLFLGLVSIAISNIFTIPQDTPVGERIGYTALAFLAAILLAVLVAFMWALFRAPYEQRNVLRATTVELRKQIQSESPDLEGSFNQVGSGDISIDGQKTAVVLLTMTIVNRGAPTFVDEWDVTAIVGGTRLKLPLQFIPAHTTIRWKGGGVQISGEDAIYQKGMAGVGRGAAIRGPIMASLIGLTRQHFHQPGNFVEVSFADFTKRTYSIQAPLGGPESQFKYFPGSGKVQDPEGYHRKPGRRA
jgi:hypothetical protein